MLVNESTYDKQMLINDLEVHLHICFRDEIYIQSLKIAVDSKINDSLSKSVCINKSRNLRINNQNSG